MLLRAGLCLWLATVAWPAHAATFAVNTSVDSSDSLPGDGQCASSSGGCSVRAAVEESNANGGPTIVQLPPGKHRLTGGPLIISSEIQLVGMGTEATSIQGARRFRLVEVRPGANVTLRHLRLERGRAEIGGGILNEGALLLSDVSVTQSVARRPAGGLGGGIYNAGSMTLTRVRLERNFALGRIGGLGGSVYNNGAAVLSEVEVRRSRANGCGGALYQNEGVMSLNGVRIERNSASSSGGGLFQQAGSVHVERASFLSNWARQIGGGVFTYSLLELVNTTLSGNRASIGGGLFGGITPAVMLTNVTVAANRARQGAGLMNNSTILLRNTIVADNKPFDCGGLPVESLGYNVAGDASCLLPRASDLQSVDARLDRLNENGSRLPSHALLPGSPAIDSANNSYCPAEDQRSQPRPRDGNGDTHAQCDRGAFEVQP